MPTWRADPPNISLINSSTYLTDQEVAHVRDALDVQVNRDFAPIWGTDCDLLVTRRGHTPPPGTWWLVVVDNPDVSGALGYHDLTNEGYPLGKVFTKVAERYNEPWPSVASHELLEMLADPYVYLVAGPDINGTCLAYEVCDPCQEETYEINGLPMSNFVHPSWFGTGPAYQGKYDHLGNIKAPFSLRPGGYLSIWRPGIGWHNVFASSTPDEKTLLRARKPAGSRTERRRAILPDSQWICSTP